MKKDLTIHGTYAYHSFPDGDGTHPGLILIEEIWGVNDHIKSVADRFAKEGYSVIAPELLPAGVLEKLTPQINKDLFDPEKRHATQPILREAMQPMLQPEYAKATIETLKACVDYVRADAHVAKEKIAVLGFCFGGTYAFHLAANDERIAAAVPFYGRPPSPDEISNINGPILAFYGEKDTDLMQSLPKLKDDMLKNGIGFEAVTYPAAGHAFFNDTNERAYVPEAAQDAWNRTLAFLRQSLA